MKDLKSKCTVENFLCLFVIMCPILDIASFLIRNWLNINFSISTFIRPVIPAGVMLYLFFKCDKKFKIKVLLVFGIFMIYSAIHIYLFTNLKTLSSYSNEIHEAQYLVNYSFMVLNLFLYVYVFKDKNLEKLKKSVLISALIYISSIYLAIITNTSSYTYMEERIGLKGWLESGNSVCAILLLSMFVYLPLIKSKKYRGLVGITIILNGVFLTVLVGTRVGLFGFIIVISVYIVIEMLHSLIKNIKINKKIVLIGAVSIAVVTIVVAIFGSNTLDRRLHLQNIEKNIVDTNSGMQAHITGDLLDIKESINNNNMELGYMTEAQKQSIIDLYNIANVLNVSNNDQRMQQLIYHISLVKNQSDPVLVLFGNGYMTSFRELVFEMEVPAILFNFGLIGFLLYLGPFLLILLYSIFKALKRYNVIDSEFIFLILGLGFAFAISLLSGYTFFNQSSALMIVLISTFLVNKLMNEYKMICEEGENNEKNINGDNGADIRRSRESVGGYCK